ncbi:MAG: acyl-CoA synthetase [Pseudomonadota bacterium]
MTTPLHPGIHAAARPDKPAIIMGSGLQLSFAALEACSNQLAHVLRQAGCQAGDHIAIMMENTAWFLCITWAAQRAGLYYTPINWHLKRAEAAYVINDCGAKALFTSSGLAELATSLAADIPAVARRFSIGPVEGFEELEALADAMPTTPIEDETEGMPMLYSSGTTGNPKGIKRPLTGKAFGATGVLEGLMQRFYKFGPDAVFLCPGPLYHSAPLNYAMATIRLGGTAVIMESFDPETLLQLIERHKVNRGQFVPTHFIRMLHLPEDVRARYDVSSMRYAIHAAAPCPIEVKEAMLAWWGPVIYEYYAGSEANGFCMISPSEWLAHKGSVGQPAIGPIHIIDPDTGETLPQGEKGLVYFEGAAPFEYHNDPEKTRAAFRPEGWSTLGDIGYLDADGFLYLTDRKSHMIISGGVNIYPQEVENCLAVHPDVRDVAVIGIPNAEFGEEVKAVIELKEGLAPTEALAADIIAYARDRIAHLKCPRSVDFVDELPRLPNGKLLKRQIRAPYWT